MQLMKHHAVNEDTNLSKSLRSSVLDDGTLWMHVQKLQEPIHPLSSVFFSFNFARLKSAEFHRASRNVTTTLQCLPGSLLTEKEHQAVTKGLGRLKGMTLECP